MSEADYKRIEAMIACDDSPVGIDARRTHVLILAKLESIEQRLGALEARQPTDRDRPAVPRVVEDGVGMATDAFDATARRLAARGVDVDARMRGLAGFLEAATDERVLACLGRLVERIESLEAASALANEAPRAMAALVDTFDEQVGKLAADGVEIDTVLRNGLRALLFLGQRVSTQELDVLGALLRSDVLHPRAVEIVGQMGCALVSAAEAPRGSVGPFGAVSKLGDRDARRSTAFVLEFARRFGAALNGEGRDGTTARKRSSES